MRLDDLDYDLPPELIAQHPAARRGDSRLLVVEAGADAPSGIGRFGESFLAQLRDDDLVVVNDTRVLHARLQVERPGGGAAELLLLEPLTPELRSGAALPSADAPGASLWTALARPARRLRAQMQLRTQAGARVTAVERRDGGEWVVQLPVSERDAPGWLLEHGQLPLPPYITPNGQRPEQYQTVYAGPAGSVAAPTAGLHLDEQTWAALRSQHEVATVTLHVGAGTFLPVRDSLDEHHMHSERYEVPAHTDAAIRAALSEGRRVVAVGTTTTRVLETVYCKPAAPLAGSTRLFVRPGYRFACVGALLTNFHLPRSTLLALVMAFAGEHTTRAAYRYAIEQQLRFYSFGDAMFVHGAAVGAQR